MDILIELVLIIAASILWSLIMVGISAWGKKIVAKQNKKIDPLPFKVKINPYGIGAWIFFVVFFALAAALFPVLYLCNIVDGLPIEAAVGAAVGFGLGAILFGVLLIAFKRWGIEVSEEGIKFTPYFGKRKEYGWQDISRVEVSYPYDIAYYKVYINQKSKQILTFSPLMAGGVRLAELLREKLLIW